MLIAPAPLVHTPHPPRAVVEVHGATDAAACLRGGETLLPAGARLGLDFGEELVGVLELEVTADAATTLELIEGEDLEEAMMLKDPLPADHWYHQPRDILKLTSGPQTARTQGRRAFRFVNVVVHGPGRLRLRGAKMILEHAPVTDRGAFACSDPLLNDAWAISRRTIRLCLQGFYEDGVKRDGMLWIGDYRVEFLCASYLFGEAALARRSLEMFAQCRHDNGSLSAVALRAGGHMHPRINYQGELAVAPGGLGDWVLDNYCADFVCGVWEYVLHTGDTSLASSLWPVVQGVLGFLGRVDLAATKAGRTFITDNQPDDKDWWGSRPALAYQLASAFADGAKLADLMGEASRAREFRRQHCTRLSNAAQQFGDPAAAGCLDDFCSNVGRGLSPTSGAQTSGINPDPHRFTATRSWHAHAAAFLAGAISADELRTIFPRLQSDPKVRRPMAGFMEFYLLQAWLDAGLASEALDEMRSYYGQMLRSGATTTWELVDRREPGIDHINVAGRSHCHGWSAGPAYLLPAKILGVTPTAPGFREVSIRPQLGDLAWAKGEIPTPHGNIAVILEGSTGEISLPAGVTGALHLPGRDPVKLAGGRTHKL